ncbi:hypothetical protein GCM10011348_07580 [Marinobacterium nitratireducens]|uniref:Uncharacterized protein n=1 Tax=Marinobacterium nitratireducens TaxID=518897 RepID=A0A918DNX1_9GAMM|nr:hypothetical protein [Marinobacterium nitratireducens]GGO77617.1 hypothetical protein GCM10011348_07580 [Marinobacterium nitratireducens]
MKTFFLTLIYSLSFSSITVASEFDIKGLKWRMSAEQIAQIAGGTTKYDCASAIPDKKWTYGGLDGWSASCEKPNAGYLDRHLEAVHNIVATKYSGLFQIHAITLSEKVLGESGFTVPELVVIFSKNFGDFKTTSYSVTDGLGRNFTKLKAVAVTDDAIVTIEDGTYGPDHQDFIELTIEDPTHAMLMIKADEEVKNASIKKATEDF